LAPRLQDITARCEVRIVLSFLALSAAGVLVAGCGSSASSTTTSPQGSHASTAGVQAGKVQAIAYAHEVNLSAADVPGAAVRSGERERGAPSQENLEFASCAGTVSPNRRVVDVKSPTFRIGQGAELRARRKISQQRCVSAAVAATGQSLRGVMR